MNKAYEGDELDSQLQVEIISQEGKTLTKFAENPDLYLNPIN